VRWEMEPVGNHSRDPYMARSGRSGVDLYGRDGTGRWRWVGAQEPFGDPNAHGKLTKLELDGVERAYRLYFPLLRRTLKLEVGADAGIHSVEREPGPPIVYYGTSIVHGAGVSRPGCGHVQRLSMALDYPILNLGFCGRAFLEKDMAKLLGRQSARLLVVDPLPNNSVESLRERLPAFLEILGNAHPGIPLLVVEERLMADAAFMPERGATCAAKNRALREIVEVRRRAGQTGIHIAAMTDYYGSEGSTDANHPNDLGANRLTMKLLPILQRFM